MKPELSTLFNVEESNRAREKRTIQLYNQLYEELGYKDPILCLKENIGKVVTSKEFLFL